MKTVGDLISQSASDSAVSDYVAYAALMLLLLATYFADKLPLGAFHAPVSYAIAIAKAALVVWYFMRLRVSQKLILMLFGGGLLILAISAVLTMSDYLTRG